MFHPVINLASASSVWRGLEYYRNGQVLSCEQGDDEWVYGTVLGSEKEPYHVQLSLKHPRQSTCDCPHAKDRKVVCKHKVALFFEAVPNSEEDFLEENERARIEDELLMEQLEEQRRRERVAYVMSLTKAQLQEELIQAYERLEDQDYYDSRDWW